MCIFTVVLFTFIINEIYSADIIEEFDSNIEIEIFESNAIKTL